MVKLNILVTGCSSGIGRCVALGLKQRGHHVFATVRKRDDLESLRAQGVDTFLLDLQDSASIRRTVAEIMAKTDNRLDVLFNNAAYGQAGAVEDLSRAALRTQLETNLLGTVELTNLVIPFMRKQKFGRIIQNSSVLGFVPLPYRGAYVTSKFALEGLSDTLRLELHGSGIDVCLIEPGPITSRFRANAHTTFKKYIVAANSAHREQYLATEKRLSKPGPAAPFTLPADAVLKKVIHAVESAKPKVRYYVTFPTYLFATLKRVLPYRILDKILLWVARSELR